MLPNLSWPQTHCNAPASAYRVQELQACTNLTSNNKHFNTLPALKNP